MNVGTVYVEIRANTSQLRGDTDRARQQVVNNLRQGHSEMRGMVTNMRRALIAGLGFMVLRGITQGAREMVGLAIAAEETANLFNVSMGGMAQAGTAWVDKLSAGFGIYRADVMKSVGTMNVMLKSMGMTEQQAFDMSTSITQLSIDMASFYNLPVEDAWNKLRAGMVGMSRPLQQLGILVNETSIKETAMREGIIKTDRELTNREKVLARHMTIMKATTAAQGDMARTFYSSENVLRRESAKRKETMEDAGEAVVKPATHLSKLWTEALNNIFFSNFVVSGARQLEVLVRTVRFVVGGVEMVGATVADIANDIVDAVTGKRDFGGKRVWDAFWTEMFQDKGLWEALAAAGRESNKLAAEAAERREIPDTMAHRKAQAQRTMREALGLDVPPEWTIGPGGKPQPAYRTPGRIGRAILDAEAAAAKGLAAGPPTGPSWRPHPGLAAGYRAPSMNLFNRSESDQTVRELERLNEQMGDVVVNTRNVGALR